MTKRKSSYSLKNFLLEKSILHGKGDFSGKRWQLFLYFFVVTGFTPSILVFVVGMYGAGLFETVKLIAIIVLSSALFCISLMLIWYLFKRYMWN